MNLDIMLLVLLTFSSAVNVACLYLAWRQSKIDERNFSCGYDTATMLVHEKGVPVSEIRSWVGSGRLGPYEKGIVAAIGAIAAVEAGK